MRFVRAFGRFWYDLVIGDDWKIAAAVVVALAALAAAVRFEVLGDTASALLVGLAFVAAFVVSVAIDARAHHDR
ncbi:hypothetical protein [Actinomadura chibensis]|uniref:Uncharacterized protein n=1 Tax=Actinomadura chibensis TaxID=392828 RepID=A0A5D0NBW3_9ACTN|nr:hypothetical protein [Actinomadura chibensis]TYB41817.1 hypothetical protein FXF69_33315 [Actinomadura chibensis]